MRFLKAALWLLLAVGLMGQTPTATPTAVAPSTCTLTGIVVNPDGSPFTNGTINFNSKSVQVINSWPVYPTIVNTNTDASGNIVPVALPQGLVMQVTICPGKQQTANCAAPFSGIVPFTQTAPFGQMAQGVGLTPGLTTATLTTLGVTGTLTFPDNSSYTSSGLNKLTVTGPTNFIGTPTFPDGSTATTAGLNNVKALGVGTAAPATAGQIVATTEALTGPNSDLYFGAATAPYTGSISTLSGSQLALNYGAHYNGSAWIADATSHSGLTLTGNAFGFYISSGTETVGNPLTPSIEVGAIDWNGFHVSHMMGNLTGYAGSVTNATFGGGSNDTYGYINASAWPVTLTFGKPFVGSAACVATTAVGYGGIMYTSANSTTAITFNCQIYTGASCGTNVWFAYHCFGVG